ncbi:MAG: hypothetical protein AB1445_03375 [Bacillota bacterium]
MGTYLHYLAHRDISGLLNTVELSNLELIRDYALAFHSGFGGLLHRIQYEESSPAGYSTIKYYRWSQIQKDQELIAVDRLDLELNLLLEVGSSDPGFQAHLAERRALGPPWYLGLGDSGEQELGEDEMLDRAREFLSPLIDASIADQLATPPATPGRNSVAFTMSGGGFGSSVGGYRTFTLQDPGTGCEYTITVTAVGGHIMQAGLHRRSDAPASLSVLLEKADALLDRWVEFEGASLTRLQSQHGEQRALFAYAAVAGAITYVDRLVGGVL